MITLLLPPQAPKRDSDEELPDFSNIFNMNVISKRYLAQSLIRLYVDIENTGSRKVTSRQENLRSHAISFLDRLLVITDNQFHEKVGPRNNVYRILEHLCDPVGSAARAVRSQAVKKIYDRNFFS